MIFMPYRNILLMIILRRMLFIQLCWLPHLSIHGRIFKLFRGFSMPCLLTCGSEVRPEPLLNEKFVTVVG